MDTSIGAPCTWNLVAVVRRVSENITIIMVCFLIFWLLLFQIRGPSSRIPKNKKKAAAPKYVNSLGFANSIIFAFLSPRLLEPFPKRQKNCCNPNVPKFIGIWACYNLYFSESEALCAETQKIKVIKCPNPLDLHNLRRQHLFTFFENGSRSLGFGKVTIIKLTTPLEFAHFGDATFFLVCLIRFEVPRIWKNKNQKANKYN